MRYWCFLVIFISPFAFSTIDLQAKNKLSKEEKRWVRNHIFRANKARKVTKRTLLRVNNLMLGNALDNYNTGGEIDAFRHAFWMAYLTKKIGEKHALELGEAHEKGNYEQYLKGILEDKSLPDSISGEMDLRNNKIGAFIGKTIVWKKTDELEKVVISFIKEGKLWMLKRNQFGELVNCEGMVVEKRADWYLPYCLVPSN